MKKKKKEKKKQLLTIVISPSFPFSFLSQRDFRFFGVGGGGEGGCWSNVIFNAFTFKNPVEYVFTLTALCPHLRLYEYLKSAGY